MVVIADLIAFEPGAGIYWPVEAEPNRCRFCSRGVRDANGVVRVEHRKVFGALRFEQAPLCRGVILKRVMPVQMVGRNIQDDADVSAELLKNPSKTVDCDVLVCSNDENAKKIVLDLVKGIVGARGFDAGPLENSRTVEQITALLVSLNIRYKVKNAGLRITGISHAS